MSVGVGEVKTVRKQIKTSLIRKAKPISILIPTKETDYKMIKTGFMPNFVHSLDASNIHLLIKNINNLNLKNLNLYTIHDCFASDYLTIELIELLVKISFVELYFNQNYLNKVHESFISQINGLTTIFKEYDNEQKKDVNYIIINKNKNNNKNKYTKIVIPDLPDISK